MPELPDAAVFKQYLDATALHKPVIRVGVADERVLDAISPQQLGQSLQGRVFSGSRRHGKHLFVQVGSRAHLALHFGMTGSLSYRSQDERAADYTKVRFDFEGGGHLDFVCPRMFGRVALVENVERFLKDHDIGPDALDLSRQELRECLGSSPGMVKSTLMDQSKLAGIGNIYSDEILYQARVHPRARATDLDETRIDRLHDRMRQILREAIERRADPSNMPSDWLIRHRSDGDACPLCGGTIETLPMGSSTGYHCPAHQSS